MALRGVADWTLQPAHGTLPAVRESASVPAGEGCEQVLLLSKSISFSLSVSDPRVIASDVVSESGLHASHPA
jgi:hypothetical protein